MPVDNHVSPADPMYLHPKSIFSHDITVPIEEVTEDPSITGARLGGNRRRCHRPAEPGLPLVQLVRLTSQADEEEICSSLASCSGNSQQCFRDDSNVFDPITWEPITRAAGDGSGKMSEKGAGGNLPRCQMSDPGEHVGEPGLKLGRAPHATQNANCHT